MKKQKTTKKALLSSVLSLVLCISMLIGTTFAWFTDSVSSTGNKIESGTLKVDLELLDKNTNVWNSIKESKQAIFDYDLWEPGYTDMKIFKIQNEGSLALKWVAKFVSANELTKLANVIDVYVSTSVTEYPTDRVDLSGWKHAGTVAQFVNTIEQTTYGTLAAQNDGDTDEATLAIVLKMQETAGNEYQGLDLGGAFDIQVLATQLNAEEDSFGPDYDINAEYAIEVTTADELAKALKAGNNVKLLADIVVDETIVIPEGSSSVLNLNSKTINVEFVEGSTTNHLYAIHNYGDLIIGGNGIINTRGIFNYGDMTLVDGTINAIDGNGGYGVRNYEGATFTMNGGKIATTLEDDNKVNEGGYDATPVRVDEGATFTMNGGELNNICDFTCALDNYGDTTLNGGSMTSIHTTMANYGTLNVNDGQFKCNGLENITAHAVWAAAGTTNISGGTFDGKDNYNGFNVDASKGAIVNITGGNFLPVHSGSLYGEGTIIVKGGTFASDPSARVASDCLVVDNKNGTWSVFAEGSTMSLNDGSVLDLGGKSFQGTVEAKGDLTINGDTTVKTLTSTSGANITVEDGKKLTLNNFSFGTKSNASAEYVIEGGTVEAAYGFFQHGTYDLYSDFETGYMYYSYGSDITVYGTFHSQGKGDGLDYVRGKVTIANGGKSIHDKSLWVGQPESWGPMSATLVVGDGGYVKANSLNIYAGSTLQIDAKNLTAGEVTNIECNSIIKEGTIEVINNDTLTAEVQGNKIILK